MQDLLKTALDWLAEQRTAHMAGAITYRRGADEAELPATAGQTVFEVEDTSGVLVKTVAQDFIVLTRDLVLGGERILPQRGDRVRHGQGDATCIYEVLPFGDEGAYRFTSPHGNEIRIHTKQVATE